MLFFCLNRSLGAADATTRPFVHPLFSDHAVLQRDMPIPIWGWGSIPDQYGRRTENDGWDEEPAD